jgi:hypothetical protein
MSNNVFTVLYISVYLMELIMVALRWTEGLFVAVVFGSMVSLLLSMIGGLICAGKLWL